MIIMLKKKPCFRLFFIYYIFFFTENTGTSEAQIFTNDFKLFDISTCEISNENPRPTLNHNKSDKTFDAPTITKTTNNLDDILGDFPMPNAKMNGILKPNRPDVNSFTTNNVPLNRKLETQEKNSKPAPTPTQTFSTSKSSYNAAYFDFNNTTTTNPSSTNNPKVVNDIFGDILNEQGYTFTNKTSETPVSINDLYKKDMVAQMGPEEAKVFEWSKGKKNNIRGLLCTLHTVLWSDAKWQGCEMSQVVTPADVKRNYRKACLAVHPDKHNGTENEHVAKLIFMELNHAWSNFENDTTQQKLFS